MTPPTLTPASIARSCAGSSEPRDIHLPEQFSWRPRSSTLRFRSILYLLTLDLLAIFVAFTAVAAVRGLVTSDQSWLLFGAILLPVYAVIAFAIDAYSADNVQDPFRAIKTGGRALIFSLATLILSAFYLKSSETFPRLTIAGGSLAAAFLLSVARYWFVTHMTAVVGGNPFSAILIREGEAPIPDGDFSIVLAAGEFFDPDRHDPMMYDRLAKSLASADRVVVACQPERRQLWARALRGANIQGEIAIPELAALTPLGLRADWLMPSVIIATGSLGLFDRAVKRVLDLTLSAGALLLLAPAILIVAVAIRLDSAGPVLFRQTRIGQGNRMFQMFKFRSMRADVSDRDGNRSTARDDDRITRVGALIRRTSLDELPQLINVLRGEMSIVGPRPHAIGSRAADKLFWEIDSRYWDRHAAKPGLTGLAQVRGFRGATPEESDLRQRLQADLEYLENWSVWRDLKIIFLTLRVIRHGNAF